MHMIEFITKETSTSHTNLYHITSTRQPTCPFFNFHIQTFYDIALNHDQYKKCKGDHSHLFICDTMHVRKKT